MGDQFKAVEGSETRSGSIPAGVSLGSVLEGRGEGTADRVLRGPRVIYSTWVERLRPERAPSFAAEELNRTRFPWTPSGLLWR